MSREHLSEIELLELVEGDLPEAQEASARAHVASCLECSQSVARLEQARGALRASPLLELPDERWHAALDALPAQEAEAPRRRAVARPRRWLAVLAPAAAAVVVAVVVVGRNGGGGDEEAAAPVAASPAETVHELQADAAQPEAAAAEAAPAPAEPAAEPPVEPAEPPAEAAGEPEEPLDGAGRLQVRSVAGTPAAVAELLRRRDLDAEVVAGMVVVEGADADAVREALAALPDGDVAVVVVPPS